MLRNMARSLFETGEITTTKAKAKEIKSWVDKILPLALENSLESKRKLHEYFGKRDVVNTLTEVVAPAMESRSSGFTTLELIGRRRGDNAFMAKLSLIKKSVSLGSFKRNKQQVQEK